MKKWKPYLERKKVLVLLVICAMFAVSGCHQSKSREIENFPESYMIEKENEFAYQSGYECSAFSSAYILRHFDEEAEGVELFKNYPGKVSDGGVSPTGIVNFFEGRGYEIEFRENGSIEEIKSEISKGVPLIAFIRVHDDEPYTHYVPMIGYDETYLYFAESLDYKANFKEEQNLPYNRRTEIAEFEKLWNDIDGYWDQPYFVVSKPN